MVDVGNSERSAPALSMQIRILEQTALSFVFSLNKTIAKRKEKTALILRA